MTTTQLLTSQAIGTGSNKGDDKFPTKHSLTTSNSALVVSMSVVTGAGGQGILDERSDIEMFYAISPASVAAADAPEVFKQQARYVSMKCVRDASKTRYKESELEVMSGGYLYIWFNVPEFVVAAALNAWVTEV